MSAATLRAILAQVEQAHLDLTGALEEIGPQDESPPKSKRRRLRSLVIDALVGAEQAGNVCRELLHVEERHVARQTREAVAP